MARQRIVAIAGTETPMPLGPALLGWTVVIGVAGYLFWRVVRSEAR